MWWSCWSVQTFLHLAASQWCSCSYRGDLQPKQYSEVQTSVPFFLHFTAFAEQSLLQNTLQLNVHEQHIGFVSVFAVTFQFVGGHVECNSSDLILCMWISLLTFRYLPCASSASFVPSCCYPDAAAAQTDTDPFAFSCSLLLSDIFGVWHVLQGQAVLLCMMPFEVLAPSPCEWWLTIWWARWDTGKDDVCIQLKKTKPSQRGWRGPGLIGHEGEENCSQGSMPWHSKRAKNCLASPANVAFWQENSVVIPTLLQLHVPVVAQDHGPHTAACAFLKISQQLSWQKLPVQYMGEALPRAP